MRLPGIHWLITFRFQYVFIKNNPLSFVCQDSLRGLPIRIFTIINGLLTAPPTITDICDTLMHISLAWNRIAHIPRDYFSGCHHLMSVDFAHNKLHSFPDVSSVAIAIINLHFPYNMINDIQSLHIYFPKLTKLSLQHNQISQFNFDYNKMQCLINVNVEDNKLHNLSNIYTFVTAPPSRDADRIRFIKLAYNPWSCSEEFTWLFSLTHTERQITSTRCFRTDLEPIPIWWHGKFSSGLCDVQNITCASPQHMRGCSLIDTGKFLLNDTHLLFSSMPPSATSKPSGKIT